MRAAPSSSNPFPSPAAPLPGRFASADRSATRGPDPCTERVRRSLEELDDAVFTALTGDLSALHRARSLWPMTLIEFGWEHVAESREQYLRRAAEVATRPDPDNISTPQRAMAAMEIVTLLTRY
ncbi:MAG: hypothetical protein AAGA92_12265 [Planctomycetota bacterium]